MEKKVNSNRTGKSKYSLSINFEQNYSVDVL